MDSKPWAFCRDEHCCLRGDAAAETAPSHRPITNVVRQGLKSLEHNIKTPKAVLKTGKGRWTGKWGYGKGLLKQSLKQLLNFTGTSAASTRKLQLWLSNRAWKVAASTRKHQLWLSIHAWNIDQLLRLVKHGFYWWTGSKTWGYWKQNSRLQHPRESFSHDVEIA